MLLDIGIGITAALLAGKLFAIAPAPLFIGAGVLFALAPDVDFLYAAARHLQRRDWAAIIRHRDLIHHPLVYLPAGLFFTGLMLGKAWALLFLVASLGHFIHDSIGLGWGIAWLWPLSQNNFGFFYRYTTPGKPLPRRFVYIWKRSEIDGLIREYRDPNWFENIYLKPHPLFVTELIGLIFALALLAYSGAGWRIQKPFLPEAKATPSGETLRY